LRDAGYRIGDGEALFFEGSNNSLDHPIFFRAVGCDEVLLQYIAFDHGRVASAGKDQPLTDWSSKGIYTRPRVI